MISINLDQKLIFWKISNKTRHITISGGVSYFSLLFLFSVFFFFVLFVLICSVHTSGNSKRPTTSGCDCCIQSKRIPGCVGRDSMRSVRFVRGQHNGTSIRHVALDKKTLARPFYNREHGRRCLQEFPSILIQIVVCVFDCLQKRFSEVISSDFTRFYAILRDFTSLLFVVVVGINFERFF